MYVDTALVLPVILSIIYDRFTDRQIYRQCGRFSIMTASLLSLFIIFTLASCLLGTPLIHFPVTVDRGGSNVGFDGTQQFIVPEGNNPLKALRSFCGMGVLGNMCSSVRDYLVQLLSGMDPVALDHVLPSYIDDTILTMPGHENGYILPSLLVWNAVELPIDLSQLGKGSISSILSVPPFDTNIEAHVTQFCSIHSLKGMYCRELHSDVDNYLTSLYHRLGGVTLRNVLEGMHYFEYFQQIWFFVDVHRAATTHAAPQVVRKFFVPFVYELLDEAVKFCVNNGLSRVSCSAFAEHFQVQIEAHYNHVQGQLWQFLYVTRALSHIVLDKQQASRSSDKTEGLADFVDADFIEIGTSNFNTITQLIDDTDGLVGFAVEPSLHYLNSLPNKTGVTKANCAIVSATDAAQGVKSVDFYYIPEETIKRLHLGDFMMGCNSVGDYHGMQVKLGYQKHVVIEKVQAYSLESFLHLHKIRRIRLLKIDAEGYDLVIMEELYQYMVAKNDTRLYPERILFETNDPDPVQKSIVRGLIEKFQKLGYVLMMHNDDTILEFSGPYV